jgi:hypothetical protein
MCQGSFNMEDYPTMGNMFDRMMNSAPDPIHAMMMKRKKQKDNIDTPPPPSLEHSTDDISELQEFCRQYGIVGFNFGNMPPQTALRMLKSKLGIIEKENYNKSINNKEMLFG